jgi:hypothetical protein
VGVSLDCVVEADDAVAPPEGIVDGGGWVADGSTGSKLSGHSGRIDASCFWYFRSCAWTDLIFRSHAAGPR